MNTVNAECSPSAPPSYEEATNFARLSIPSIQTIEPTSQSDPQQIGLNVNAILSVPFIVQQTAPLMNQQQPIIIIQQQNILPLLLGSQPTFVLCPACHVQKLTRIERVPNSSAHLAALVLLIMGCWCFVCLPYCCEDCMNTKHYCGNCNQYLGTYKSNQHRI